MATGRGSRLYTEQTETGYGIQISFFPARLLFFPQSVTELLERDSEEAIFPGSRQNVLVVAGGRTASVHERRHEGLAEGARLFSVAIAAFVSRGIGKNKVASFPSPATAALSDASC